MVSHLGLVGKIQPTEIANGRLGFVDLGHVILQEHTVAKRFRAQVALGRYKFVDFGRFLASCCADFTSRSGVYDQVLPIAERFGTMWTPQVMAVVNFMNVIPIDVLFIGFVVFTQCTGENMFMYSTFLIC